MLRLDYQKECLEQLKKRLEVELPKLSARLDTLKLQKELKAKSNVSYYGKTMH